MSKRRENVYDDELRVSNVVVATLPMREQANWRLGVEPRQPLVSASWTAADPDAAVNNTYKEAAFTGSDMSSAARVVKKSDMPGSFTPDLS